jgi:ferric-dicitrate binding protein FerR (iron transport regulator)
MKTNPQHTTNNDLETKVFKHVEVSFNNSKDDVWKKMSAKIDFKNPPKKSAKVIELSWLKLTSAAAILVLFGSALFMKYYTVSVGSNLGEKFSHTLPDNSEVFLNENSSLSYQPYWWMFSRELEFEGEAFFEVEKGKKFTVKSDNGSTSVLGTSFNINSRKNYSVYCKTGKVAVVGLGSVNTVVLSPNELVSFDGEYGLKEEIKDENLILNWRKGLLIFESVPLIEVFDELEFIYNVNLKYESSDFSGLNYSANYKKPSNIEDVLELMILNFDFTYSKLNEDYVITKN